MRIKQLPPHEAHKIAAGEVVDRPSNVVKELIENSIDAGATQITLYIENAGQQKIRIIDNGCGMSPEDARLSIAQYATSKITSVDDLAHISTFGFRGEALASIAAVSKVTLVTKEQDAEQGVELIIENSAIMRESFVGCNTGTDITIDDLFYNVPARKKFLKKTDTEWRSIIQLVHACCLCAPSIGFKLFHDGRQILNCPPVQTVHDRATQLWDRSISQNIISLSPHDSKKGMLISGLISNHHYYRYDRTHIFFFVNNRWIKNYTLSNALLKGYLNAIPPQRSPLAVLFITVDQADIDVNIHPRKEEVQFLHPRIIETLLQDTVKKTLELHLSNQIKKSVSFAPYTPPQQESFQAYQPFQPSPFFKQPTKPIFSAPEVDSFNFDEPAFKEESTQPSTILPESPELHQQSMLYEEYVGDQKAQETTHHYQLIGQYNKTYLLLEHEEGLFLVDQHAAHERILYELFEKRFHEVATVALLFPQIVTLTIDDLKIITPYLDLFNQNGILIEPFGSNQLIIQSTPVHLKNYSCDELIKETLSWIKQEQGVAQSDIFRTIHEKLRAQMACKAAVKAGDELTMQQMQTLLDDLDKTENRFTCPHGRPTGWLLSLHEIEKKFKRKK